MMVGQAPLYIFLLKTMCQSLLTFQQAWELCA